MTIKDRKQSSNEPANNSIRRPHWLKIKPPGGESFADIKKLMRSKSLCTVCEEARCPNISECWNSGTATFMILGSTCNRLCKFCAVAVGKIVAPDPNEPDNIAESIKKMGLKHAVITSVTRDDLPDGGSQAWADVINKVKEINDGITLEVLIPDFKGSQEDLNRVLAAKPNVLNHNVETITRLYKEIRPQARYERSLELLERAKKQGFKTKTGIMLGLGETYEEVIELMHDVRKRNVDIMTIGQYLQPSKEHVPVDRYVHPDEFEKLRVEGLKMGFEHVESAPLVRSSYHAIKHV